MALSQDEQRILAEIEERLANDDPGLASSLTGFRRPGPAKMLRRSPRVRIVGSLFAVLLVAMVSLTVYAMIPFRAHMPRQPPPPTVAASANTAISAATSSQPSATQQSSASLPSASGSTASGSTASQVSPNRSGAAVATSKPQQGQVKATSTAMLPTANP
jgi:cytoskeletal protein RodZ